MMSTWRLMMMKVIEYGGPASVSYITGGTIKAAAAKFYSDYD